MKIYIATGNSKKLKVISDTLKDLNIEVEGVVLELNEEQTIDMEKISKEKCIQAFEQIKKPVLVDDSGVYFEKYNQFPGVYAKPVFQGLGFSGLIKLFEEGDKAYFQTVISYIDDKLKEPVTFVGHWHGRLSKKYNNLGKDDEMPYNQIFIPNNYNCFVCEMKNEEGESISQRVIAVKKFKDWYKENRVD